ncbi:molecular chaperone [Sphingomonas lutea]|uniref:Molecular chaperone n=1 Tax=Sphingomonas lutea TaxID=1045317 RepID=A0A7G9SIJ5_9SPHN|nr:molecular chaperone [Sphingomonas lutea]QNN67670.1 molecular chaperone [Sphingomonas lutea]
MKLWTRTFVALAVAAPLLTLPMPASAGVGDLLVAPTRVVLDGRKGTEIILNNIGEEPATYRVSVEFRRMTAEGGLEDVVAPSAAEKLAEEMIVYAPRRVTLAPREPQAIRLRARVPQGVADGEYRVHLLFRAIPPATPVVQASAPTEAKGVSFQITPVYGVTIPVIVRLGNLSATAAIADVRLDTKDGKKAVSLELSRKGNRSTFGEVRVLKPGVKTPIALQRTVAVYTEVDKRRVTIPIDERFTGQLSGPVTVQYAETFDDGAKVIAETQAVLR